MDLTHITSYIMWYKLTITYYEGGVRMIKFKDFEAKGAGLIIPGLITLILGGYGIKRLFDCFAGSGGTLKFDPNSKVINLEIYKRDI